MSVTTLKVFTLNCWGLPFPVICKNRIERIQAIAEFLSGSDYDIVTLQEIWVKADFHFLKDRLNSRLKYSHYFYSGAIGSGVCIFSKYPIVETHFISFRLNGHAHKIYHGDWFGGKGVGLAKIQIGELDVSVYCTHFHAEYNPGNDEYHAHRICQSFELGQVIKTTMEGSDLVLVAGDLNTPPGCIGYKVITLSPQLTDCWEVKTNNVEMEHARGGTCNLPGNSYTLSESAKKMPGGERIDYIMYRARRGFQVSAKCSVGLGSLPGTNISYSDHEAVMATLVISKEEASQSVSDHQETLTKDLRDALQESILVLDKGVSQCLSEEKFFKLMLFLMLLGLYLLGYHTDWATHLVGGPVVAAIAVLVKLITAIGVGFCLCTALIVKRSEFYSLVGVKEDVLRFLQTGGARSRGF